MSVPAYPAYRDSGVPWIGRVPAHWLPGRVKDCFRIINGATPRSDVPEYWDGDVVWVTPADLSGTDGWDVAASQRSLSAAGLESCAATVVPPGSIVVSTRAPIGSIGIAAVPLCTNQGCRALVPHPGAETRFFAYALTAFTPQLNLHGRGTTFLELSGDALGAFAICAPPPAEQRAIAAFLDRECGKIDALVAEQERLIALLKEKRQAVISHAVTKGLDPTAPMRDSGVAWLGQVPAHWETTRLKSDLAFLTSGSRGWAQYYADEGEIFLRIGNLTRDSLNLDLRDTERVAVPDGAEGERTRVAPGDVLFSITAFMGSVAVVPEGLEPAYVSQHVALARLRGERLDPRWVGYVVLSDAGKAYLDAQCYGGTKIQLSLDDVATLPLPLPPTLEQRTIVRSIEARLAALGALTTEAERAIALLKERRAALISAAVTGKIDVRGLVAPTAAEAA